MQDTNSIEIYLPSSIKPILLDITDLHCFFNKPATCNWKVDKGDGRVKLQVNKDYKVTVNLLHRLILKPKSEQQVDHINNNYFDNRRHNLRICSHYQNQLNKPKSKNRKLTSKYKGVCWLKANRKWRVQIKVVVDNKDLYIHGGLFVSEEEAALRYNELALQYHKKFANLNVI